MFVLKHLLIIYDKNKKIFDFSQIQNLQTLPNLFEGNV